MSEVHRYKVVKMLSEDGNRISYEPHGPEVVLASAFDGATRLFLDAAERAVASERREKELQQRLTAADERADVLETALRFYAEREHYHFESGNWDTVSGEPLNILWCGDEPDFIEDGTVARNALFGSAEPGAPKCRYCGDTGQFMIGSSGDASDGNAPIMTRCEDCELGEPVVPIEFRALGAFVGAACPVANQINKRGYNWCDSYLDAALVLAQAALKPAGSAKEGHVCTGCGSKGWTANCKECVPY